VQVSINVSVFQKVTRGKKGWYYIWKDPTSGKRRTRASGHPTRRLAERGAADFEAELNRTAMPDLITWADFEAEYNRQVLDHAADGTAYQCYAAFAQLKQATAIERLEQVPEFLGAFRLALLESDLAPATQVGYLKHFRSAMNWAYEAGLLAERIKVKLPPQPETEAKGRPLTDVEYQALLLTAMDTYGQTMVDFLTGLWLSGLRLGEAMRLSWDRDAPFAVDRAGEYWRFRIRKGAQKAKRAQLAPMDPEFIDWLAGRTPRKGLVFNPLGHKGKRFKTDAAGKAVSEIGEATGIVTDEETGRHATSQDFRRSFGDRWARQLMPADLKEMMRHRSIETTMKYYVGRDVDSISARLHALQKSG
jgi:integrase